jgi:hypothetical protein
MIIDEVITLLVTKSLLLITEVRRGFTVQIFRFRVLVLVSLYITILTFCPHRVFMFRMDLRTNSTYFRIQHESNGFIAEMECIYCEIRNEPLTEF